MLFHSDALIDSFNYTASSNDSFRYLFHNAETNWPNDAMTSGSGDMESTEDNVYDALVFRTRRIGHGLGYIKFPNLYEVLKKREIAIEVCPASNQILGFVADLRNHPAINYYRSGIPIVLAGDDPGSFGYNDLTVDYYLAFTAWGLRLSDLKVIANNSIVYSSMTPEMKQVGLDMFKQTWITYINATYDRICSTNRTTNKNMTQFSNVMPSYGPIEVATMLNIYGKGFENLLCDRISCLFDGRAETTGTLVSMGEIQCQTPIGVFDENQTVNVSIQVNGGEWVLDTGYGFKFVSLTSIQLVL